MTKKKVLMAAQTWSEEPGFQPIYDERWAPHESARLSLVVATNGLQVRRSVDFRAGRPVSANDRARINAALAALEQALRDAVHAAYANSDEVKFASSVAAAEDAFWQSVQ